MTQKERDQAQVERAARLRKQIEQLQREDTAGTPERSSPQSGSPPDVPKLSPRDFIHKRMRELNDKK